MFASKQRAKKMCAKSSTLSSGLSYTTTADSLSSTWRPSMMIGGSLMSSGKKVDRTRPLPTDFQPAPYSPPTAWRSKKTGWSKPSLMPGMWMVSREMVMPFQPRRMAPLGEPRGFLRPNCLTCSALGVMVGSLKMAPMRAPEATASCSTLSSVSSRDLQLKSKYSHFEVSMNGVTQASWMIFIVYHDISSPEMYVIGGATILPGAKVRIHNLQPAPPRWAPRRELNMAAESVKALLSETQGLPEPVP
mmetsp:Transcript_74998/g.242573  ORF Transcript_74998/g.242573 Transcript_74998/m.242573 type:complete len:247 (-) Transcript_74998:11-751(-)